jgi:hypothetical protein
MSALIELLEGFEFESAVNNSNGHEPGYWMYYGDACPLEAKQELKDLQNRLEAMSENYGSAILEVEKLKALLVDLDKLNRVARSYGQGAWSLCDIYQHKIDEALGVLPFDTPSAEDVSEDEVRGKYE